MPNPEPIISQLAWEDLDYLFDAVLEVSKSVEVAENIYEGVLGAIELAAEMPGAEPSVFAKFGIACDYRWTSFKDWLAFFHTLPNGGIQVDRVLWGKSDWLSTLTRIS